MSRSDRILVAAAGTAIAFALAAAWILLAPPAGQGGEPSGSAAVLVAESQAPQAPSGSPEPTRIVVDVEGAVVEPGVRDLPPGSRVADAIAAAGGYAPDADLEAAAVDINLAERLIDGAQVIVPRIGSGPAAGETPDPPTAGTDSDEEPAGPLDLNTASSEELEALPGIGPVTVDRIISARQERPFSSLQDAVDRGVLDRGQLEDIEGLATAG